MSSDAASFATIAEAGAEVHDAASRDAKARAPYVYVTLPPYVDPPDVARFRAAMMPAYLACAAKAPPTCPLVMSLRCIVQNLDLLGCRPVYETNPGCGNRALAACLEAGRHFRFSQFDGQDRGVLVTVSLQ